MEFSLLALAHALGIAAAMGWEILWPLVSDLRYPASYRRSCHAEISRLLPDDSPRSIAIALALGAASSSCSYAAVAIARSIFRKGADFTASMAFEMASTNLVLEKHHLSIVFLGWPFMAAEALAAPIMVCVLAVLFRAFLRPELVREAREHADAAKLRAACGGLGRTRTWELVRRTWISASLVPAPCANWGQGTMTGVRILGVVPGPGVAYRSTLRYLCVEIAQTPQHSRPGSGRITR